MVQRQSKEQKGTVARVMHEYRHGELKTGESGPKVKSPKQAIAIALHEAGATNQDGATDNKKNLRRTKSKERRAETAQAAKEDCQRRTGPCGRLRDRSAQAAARNPARLTSTTPPSAATFPAARRCPRSSLRGRCGIEG